MTKNEKRIANKTLNRLITGLDMLREGYKNTNLAHIEWLEAKLIIANRRIGELRAEIADGQKEKK